MEAGSMAGTSQDAQIVISHGLIPSPALDGFVCVKCECGFQTKKLMRHLKSKEHSLTKEEADRVWQTLSKVAEDFPAKHAQRDVYLGLKDIAEEVSPLPGLKIVEARRCSKCPILFAKDKSLTKHMRKTHGESVKISEVRKIQKVRAQKLNKKCGTKLYAVTKAEDIEEEVLIGSGRFENLLNEYVADSISWPEVIPDDEREHTPFMHMAKPHFRLERVNLSMEKACDLMDTPWGEKSDPLYGVWQDLNQTLLDYYSDAKELAKEGSLFPAIYIAVATPGVTTKEKHFAFLSGKRETTIKNYVRHCASMILMAHKVAVMENWKADSIKMSKGLSEAAEALGPALTAKGDEAKKAVHDVLKSIYFEEGSGPMEPKDMFAYVFGACICVTRESGTAPRFRLGKNVSPILAGVLHFASVVGLMCVKRFRADGEESAELEKIERYMSAGGSTGVNVLCELRSICSALRSRENQDVRYKPCDKHKLCAYIDGEEVSVEDIGNLVRSVQEEVRNGIFGSSGLFKGRALPAGFREGLGKVVDKIGEMRTGYWFGAEARNSEFMSKAMQWVKASGIRSMTDAEADSWLKTAKEVTKGLCCLLYVTGGAPPRGTELGVLRFRNSSAGPRTVMFAGDETVSIPGYDKTRTMKSGHVRFITRHCDPETTYLAKAFLVLVHPAMVSMLTVLGMDLVRKMAEEAGDGQNWKAFVPTDAKVSENHMRENMFGGVLGPDDVARTVTFIFNKHGLHISFSQYRHWQSGYALRRCTMTNLSDKKNFHGNEGDEEGEGPMAMVLQAGHSMRTAEEIYARVEGIFGGGGKASEDTEIGRFRKASIIWHVDLGLRPASELFPAECGGSSEVSRLLTAGLSSKPVLAPSLSSVTKASGRGRQGSALNAETKRIFNSLLTEVGMQGVLSLLNETTAIGSSVTIPPANPCSVSRSKEIFSSSKVLEMHHDLPSNYDGIAGPRRLVCNEEMGSEAQMEVEYSVQDRFEKTPTECEKKINMLQGLRRSTQKDNASFKSADQRRAMEVVWQGERDVAVILATGGGKTAVVQAPMYHEHKITIWVSPLRALIDEAMASFQRAGLKALLLKEVDVNALHELKAILVRPEDLQQETYSSVLRSLEMRDKVQRIVVDEAHLVTMADSYRPCMSAMRHIRSREGKYAIVLLTATAPSAMVRNIAMATGCNEEDMLVVRGEVGRRNLRLLVKILEDGRRQLLLNAVYHCVTIHGTAYDAGAFGNTSKLVVACLTRNDAFEIFAGVKKEFDKLKTGFQTVVKLYHSKLDDDEKKASAAAWRSHKEGLFVMVCTEGYMTGVDAPDVRMVVFAGGARSMIEYWQGAGRAGRDDKDADVVVFYHESHVVRGNAGQVIEDESEQDRFVKWATACDKCRRIGVEEYFGESREHGNCAKRQGALLCDVCASIAYRRTVSASKLKHSAAAVNKDENELSVSNAGGKWTETGRRLSVSESSGTGHAKNPLRLKRALVNGGRGIDERDIWKRFRKAGRSAAEKMNKTSSEVSGLKRVSSQGISLEGVQPESTPLQRSASGLSLSAELRKVVDGEVRMLQQEGQELVGVCTLCKCDDIVSGRVLESREKYLHDVNVCLRDCHKKHGWLQRCFRCYQFGHNSPDCLALLVVGCSGCRMSTYGGLNTHTQGSVGRNCPLGGCLKMVLGWWGMLRFREKVEMARAVCEGDLDLDVRKEEALDITFCRWLCEDRCGRRPGLGRAFRWVNSKKRCMDGVRT